MFHPFSHLRSLSAAVMLVFAQTIVAAVPPVTIETHHGFSGSAPLTVRLRISVDPHIDNRLLCVQWEQVQGGAEFRSSCQSIDPIVREDGSVVLPPRTQWYLLKDLPSGKWDVVAFVRRADEKVYPSNHITLHAFGPNYETSPE